MAVDHIKVVTVDPVSDAYSWSIIDSATNSTPTWVGDANGLPVNQQSNGQDTDTWIFTVQVNTGAARQAIATVTHSTGITDSFTIAQAGNVGSPPPSSYSSITASSDPINEGQSLTFTVSGNNLSDGTVDYTLNGNGITSGDIGIATFGTISIVGATNSGSLIVPITNDALTEGNETLVITLGSADSNGVPVNLPQLNTVINDTSTTAPTQVQLTFTNNINIIGSPSQAQWNVSDITLLSGTISNSTVAMNGTTGGAQFDATAGEEVEFELELTRETAYEFTSVQGNPVATIANSIAGLTKISEDITSNAGFPNIMTMVVKYVVPNVNAGIQSVGMNATTIAAQVVADFTFTGGSVGGINPFTITQNGNNHQLTLPNNNSTNLSLGYDSNVSPDSSTLGNWFTMPSWITWSTIVPFSHNSGSNSGTLYFDIIGNSGVNAQTRSGDITYDLAETLPGTGVNHIDVSQPGIQLFIPGKSERRLKYDIEPVGESAMGIPMYHFNYKDEANGKGRFIGTMVDDLERLGFEDVLIHTKDGILVDYNKIDVPYHTITN